MVGTITIIFELVSENVITFDRMWLFFKIKNIFNLRKACFLRKGGCLLMCNCVELLARITVQCLLKLLLNENKAVPRFTSRYGTT